MKTPMSLVIAVALALDGGRDAKAFRVVCQRAVVVLYVFLHSARVSRGVRHCFLTMFTYCVRLVCHSFAVSYFRRKTKMLPHK